MCGPTARQLEVIAAVIATGSQKAAAESLCITEHAVNASVRKMRERLGDVTMPQAIYILTARGLLDVPIPSLAPNVWRGARYRAWIAARTSVSSPPGGHRRPNTGKLSPGAPSANHQSPPGRPPPSWRAHCVDVF